MAVTPQCQGLGIARRLIERAFDAFEASARRCCSLESNSKLAPAISLYASSGFTHAARPAGDAHYQRADVYMEWQGRPRG
jgi:ribosomal protein S18 acetylase RimI-like enzyme